MSATAPVPYSTPRRVLADLAPQTLLVNALLVVLGAALVGLLAQVSFHLSWTPVPITGQTLGVLLAGSALGWKRGSLSMALYWLAGMVGVPWYSNHAHGWTAATGATMGYLVGFIAAAGVCGWIASRGEDRSFLSAAGSMVVGNVIIYAFGVSWLAHFLHVSLAKAIELGLTPFLAGDAIKVLIAAAVLPGAWWVVGKANAER
jgi:biotin transport system substrate-specific component